MIRRCSEFALSTRFVIVAASVALAAVGLYSFWTLDIEAYPDPVQPRVEIITQPIGLSAEEVERLTTVPLEIGLSGMRNLESIRSISLFGLSDIKCYFAWDSDYYWDSTETVNRLAFITLPQGVTPSISPENPIGEIYRYTVEGPDHNLTREKEVEDWIVEKQLKTVPGVIDVTGFGGLAKEYHVDVDPQRLNYYQVSLSTLVSSITNSNINVGGNYLPIGNQVFDVRGLGFIESLNDIKGIVLSSNRSIPIRVNNVADVDVGYAPRLGAVSMNHRKEAVEGIVLMRKYGNTLDTLAGVKTKVASLNASNVMPRGYRLVPFYDRTDLVETTLRTVLENLTIGMVLVFVVLVFFLGNIRSAVIAAVNIPLALLGAFTLIRLTDTPANLISLGAIDFGIIIDSTVIVVENINRHLTMDAATSDLRGSILRGSEEVGSPILFSTLIFMIAFLPLFTMRGVEGAIFSPMSHTYAYALGIAILLAVSLSPVLSSYLIRKNMRAWRNPIWEGLRHFYHALFERVLAWPRLTLVLILTIVATVLSLFPLVGGEFLPKLEEGNIWARATMPLSVSLNRATRVAQEARNIFLSFPEVAMVLSQVGRPDDGTDATGFFNAEFLVNLKPLDQWPAHLTKAGLISQIDEKFRDTLPGVSFGYSQYIEDNVDEALSGVKAANSIKIFGPDLRIDEDLAGRVTTVLQTVPGIEDTAIYRSLGQPNLLIKPDRAACSRYGINVGDVGAVVQAAIGGQAVTQVLEGDRRFDLVVRWLPQYRQSLDAIRQIRVSTPAGTSIPLSLVSDIRAAEGASFIYREQLARYVPLRFAVRGRDLENAIAEAKERVAREVKLPGGVQLEWAGEYGELSQAIHRLEIVIPFSLVLIVAVLYGATYSWIDTFIIMAQVPVACLGGILALLITGIPFSVSAAVGFISIFGIAVMDGIMLSTYIRQLWDQGHPFVESIIMGSDRRLRATMMTDLVDAVGFLPAALSTRIGAQTQRPLAVVVIGGALAIALLTRVLQPALIYLCHRRLRLADREDGLP
jgi:cobalt-zinc-cadmium resistance protein CzcA